jgi:ribonuclease-3
MNKIVKKIYAKIAVKPKTDKLHELEQNLGYKFKNKKLLETALTHSSYKHENPEVPEDNQRLEFLGDSVLGLISANFVFKTFDKEQEGGLTLRKTKITNKKTIGQVAAQLSLGKFLRLGKGEEASGGRNRESNLADALEAVLGAIYLDGGIKAVEQVFYELFSKIRKEIKTVDSINDNAKGLLQEYCQKQWRISPQYQILKYSGPPHARTFTASVKAGKYVYAVGYGNSKQEAEINAAREALNKLGI